MPHFGRKSRNWCRSVKKCTIYEENPSNGVLWSKMSLLSAKIPNIEDLSRKYVIQGENPEIGMFRSKMPLLDQKSRNQIFQDKNVTILNEISKLDRFDRKYTIQGQNPKTGLFVSNLPFRAQIPKSGGLVRNAPISGRILVGVFRSKTPALKAKTPQVWCVAKK